jgi:DUF917 family protein
MEGNRDMDGEGLRSFQDIEDFTRGTDFLSANGGGVPEETRALLEDDLKRGLELSWFDLAELADDASVVSTFLSGSIAPGSFDTSEMERQLGLERKVERPLVAAVRELEAFTGKKFDTMISVEIGGTNTGLAFDAAANLGLRMVDADYAGRAIPEADCITPNIFGKRIYPMACVDYYGDVTYLKDAQHNRMAERLGKYYASASFGTVGCAAIMLSGKEVKEIAVPATLSECLAIGRAIRRARENGLDPVQAIVDELDQAWVLFRGTIASRSWEDSEGYMWGEHEIEGEDDFSGQHLRLWFKNENHMSWLNGEPYVASPDILEVVDPQTGEPLSNTYLEKGQRIVVIGVRRRPQFDNQRGLEVLGPRHWGFDVEFRPIEKLVG